MCQLTGVLKHASITLLSHISMPLDSCLHHPIAHRIAHSAFHSVCRVPSTVCPQQGAHTSTHTLQRTAEHTLQHTHCNRHSTSRTRQDSRRRQEEKADTGQSHCNTHFTTHTQHTLYNSHSGRCKVPEKVCHAKPCVVSNIRMRQHSVQHMNETTQCKMQSATHTLYHARGARIVKQRI